MVDPQLDKMDLVPTDLVMEYLVTMDHNDIFLEIQNYPANAATTPGSADVVLLWVELNLEEKMVAAVDTSYLGKDLLLDQ